MADLARLEADLPAQTVWQDVPPERPLSVPSTTVAPASARLSPSPGEGEEAVVQHSSEGQSNPVPDAQISLLPTGVGPTEDAFNWEAARFVLDFAAKVPPEEARRVADLAARTGLPMDFVSRNYDAINSHRRAQESFRVLQDSSTLRALVSGLSAPGVTPPVTSPVALPVTGEPNGEQSRTLRRPAEVLLDAMKQLDEGRLQPGWSPQALLMEVGRTHPTVLPDVERYLTLLEREEGDEARIWRETTDKVVAALPLLPSPQETEKDPRALYGMGEAVGQIDLLHSMWVYEAERGAAGFSEPDFLADFARRNQDRAPAAAAVLDQYTNLLKAGKTAEAQTLLRTAMEDYIHKTPDPVMRFAVWQKEAAVRISGSFVQVFGNSLKFASVSAEAAKANRRELVEAQAGYAAFVHQSYFDETITDQHLLDRMKSYSPHIAAYLSHMYRMRVNDRFLGRSDNLIPLEAEKAAYERTLADLQFTDPRESAIFRLGADMVDLSKAEDGLLRGDSYYDGSILHDVIPTVVGEMGAYVAAMALHPSIGLGLGVMSAGGRAFQEGLDAGLSFSEAFAASKWEAALGAAEALPITALFGRLSLLRKVPGVNELGETLVKGLAGLGAEGLQEALSQIGHNLVAKNYYDPDRDTFDGVWESAVGGSVAGGLLGIFAGALKLGQVRDRLARETDLQARSALESIREQVESDMAAITPHVRPWNTGVPGYSKLRYEDVGAYEAALKGGTPSALDPEVSRQLHDMLKKAGIGTLDTIDSYEIRKAMDQVWGKRMQADHGSARLDPDGTTLRLNTLPQDHAAAIDGLGQRWIMDMLQERSSLSGEGLRAHLNDMETLFRASGIKLKPSTATPEQLREAFASAEMQGKVGALFQRWLRQSDGNGADPWSGMQRWFRDKDGALPTDQRLTPEETAALDRMFDGTLPDGWHSQPGVPKFVEDMRAMGDFNAASVDALARLQAARDLSSARRLGVDVADLPGIDSRSIVGGGRLKNGVTLTGVRDLGEVLDKLTVDPMTRGPEMDATRSLLEGFGIDKARLSDPATRDQALRILKVSRSDAIMARQDGYTHRVAARDLPQDPSYDRRAMEDRLSALTDGTGTLSEADHRLLASMTREEWELHTFSPSQQREKYKEGTVWKELAPKYPGIPAEVQAAAQSKLKVLAVGHLSGGGGPVVAGQQTYRKALFGDDGTPSPHSDTLGVMEQRGSAGANMTMGQLHAEAAAMVDAYRQNRTQGQSMVIEVHGEDVCGYCMSPADLPALADKVGLNSLILHDYSAGKSYLWRRGDVGFTEVSMDLD